MKNMILILAIIVSSVNMKAQINKGRVMLGGDVNYRLNSNEDYTSPFTQSNFYKIVGYGTNLRYGILITDHIMIGMVGNYGSSKYIIDYADDYWQRTTYKINGYGGGLFARYYKTISGSRFAFFGQLSTTYNRTKNEQSIEYDDPNTPSESRNYEGSSIAVALNPGLTYHVNKTMAIEVMLGGLFYNSGKSKDNFVTMSPPDQKFSGFGFGLFNSFSLGLNFYFGGVSNPAPEATK